MARVHSEFVWDEVRASNNKLKHGLSFPAAAVMLADPEAQRYHVERPDESHSAREERYLTTGAHPRRRDLVVVVVWTPARDEDDGLLTRIISARHATLKERRDYERNLRQR